MSKGARAILLFLTLLVFHAAMSGTAQLHHGFLMAMGVLGCGAVTALSWRMGLIDEEGFPIEHWARTARYVPWLMWQIILSNIDVMKTVWNPELPIAPRMFRAPHDLRTSYGVITYVNSITLTPGTVTVDIGDGELLIHALTKGAEDGLLDDSMHKRCHDVEGTR